MRQHKQKLQKNQKKKNRWAAVCLVLTVREVIVQTIKHLNRMTFCKSYPVRPINFGNFVSFSP